jgi:hypothetical protein
MPSHGIDRAERPDGKRRRQAVHYVSYAGVHETKIPAFRGPASGFVLSDYGGQCFMAFCW